MPKKPLYPTVRATNGAVFELRPKVMFCIKAAKAHAKTARFSATRDEVANGLANCYVKAYLPDFRTDGVPFYHNLWPGSALALGCMNFNKSDALKIRRWVNKGEKRG